MLHSMVDICMWTRASSLHTVCITGARSVHLRLLLESRSCFSSFSWKWETAEISASCNTKHIDHTRHDMNNNRYGLPIIKANSANQCTTNILCHKRCLHQLPWNEVSCINVNAKIRIKSLCNSPWLKAWVHIHCWGELKAWVDMHCLGELTAWVNVHCCGELKALVNMH